MNKRNLATILWFLAGWMASGAIFSFTGLPSDLGIVTGLAIGGLVRWDPAGLLWKRRPADRRRVRPINDFAAELDRNAGHAAPADAERASR